MATGRSLQVRLVFSLVLETEGGETGTGLVLGKELLDERESVKSVEFPF